MSFEFYDDPGCGGLDRQYMLGDRVLVAPVFSPDGVVDYFLPQGDWTHLLTGEVVSGGGWRRGRFDYFGLPVFVRPNSLVPIGATEERPDYNFPRGVIFHLFALDDGATAEAVVPDLRGDPALKVRASRARAEIIAEIDQRQAETERWRVLLHGIFELADDSAEAIATFTKEGLLLEMNGGTRRVSVTLKT